MTERQLHSQGGIEKGKLRLSQTPLGCGQVLTGVALRGDESRKGEEVSAECRALQGAITARPTGGRSFHVSARTRTPDSTNAMEELEAQATPKMQEPEEQKAQEEVKARHTRGEGPHVQKKGRGISSTTLPEASPIPNPAESRSEEGTRGEGRHDGGRIKAQKGIVQVAGKGRYLQGTNGGIFLREEGPQPNSGPSAFKLSRGGAEKRRDCCQDAQGTQIGKGLVRSIRRGSHRQPEAGESIQPEQGEGEARRRADQGAWKTKAWRGLEKCFKRSSHAQATAVKLVPQKKGQTRQPGPGAFSERLTGRSHPRRTKTNLL